MVGIRHHDQLVPLPDQDPEIGDVLTGVDLHTRILRQIASARQFRQPAASHVNDSDALRLRPR